MADRATERMTIAAPPERVYAVAADLESYCEWVSDLKSVEILDRDGDGRPLLVRFRAAAMGQSTSYTLRYDWTAAPHGISWVLEQGDIMRKLDGEYRFEPGEGGTDVTYHLEVDLKVPLVGFIKRRAESRILHTALRELKARAEALAA